ncbi:MAG: sigma 54-interacting transcriptional regulator [Deltaproteobacteria bacterium]|nr:sigma 54-interacting transcriptional regulator [Deltaproteobacteria bacterium]
MTKGRRSPTNTTVQGTTTAGADSSLGGRDFLLVVGAGHFVTHPLPETGKVVLGRDPTCDLPLSHGRISRRHVAVHVDSCVSVQDLGSTNGIRLNGQVLAGGDPVPLSPGDSFQVGPFTIVLLRGARAEAAHDGLPRAALTVEDPTPESVPPLIARIAASPVNVLIAGETGTGKEVLATTIHQLSGRGGRNVGINCAAFTETLLESEIFGYERGAFTGAVQAKPGLFEAAMGGTVFLDEVGDMPLTMQVKLLRALETKQVTRLGGLSPRLLDVRFVAATNRDLRLDVSRGAFRADLYYRLNGITLLLPPLRERRGGISRLALHFVAEFSTRLGQVAPRVHPEAMVRLKAYSWPGNVRELRSVMERAVLLASGSEIGPAHLVLEPPIGEPAPALEELEQSADPSLDAESAKERDLIVSALDASAGNQTRAAKYLGVSRATLVNKLALYRIPRPRRK